jgi:alpha-L-fucosidase
VVDEWLIPFNERNCNLILNVGPNRDGKFDQNALDRLAEIGKLWKRSASTPQLKQSVVITTPNLACGRPSFASSSADTSGPDLANDDNARTYWESDEGQASGWIEIDLGKAIAFNTVTVVEPVYLDGYGAESRIASYRVEAWYEGKWNDIFGTDVTETKVHQLHQVVAERIRLNLTGKGKTLGIAEFGIYAEPARS